jgi:hypothetical protein
LKGGIISYVREFEVKQKLNDEKNTHDERFLNTFLNEKNADSIEHFEILNEKKIISSNSNYNDNHNNNSNNSNINIIQNKIEKIAQRVGLSEDARLVSSITTLLSSSKNERHVDESKFIG